MERPAHNPGACNLRDPAAPSSPGCAPCAGLRVLVIEDTPDHALLARRALARRGHRVTLASTVCEALSLLAGGRFDVVALDYNLPDADGLAALGEIMCRTPGMPVVMVTASGSEQVAVAALKSGARDYVVKEPGYEPLLARALEAAREQARADAAEAALRAELERRAVTDHLTGLLNRGEMERVLVREVERARRCRRPLAFGLIDVDGFKAINDTCGHPTGDRVLCRFARLLEDAVRACDFAARWGGDEFAVLLTESDLGGAAAFARRLRALVEDLACADGNAEGAPFTVSAGFVAVGDRAPAVPDLLQQADRALYAAKAQGRDRTHLCLVEGAPAAPGSAPPQRKPRQGPSSRVSAATPEGHAQ